MTTFVKTLGFNLSDPDEFSPIYLSHARTVTLAKTSITRLIGPTSSLVNILYLKYKSELNYNVLALSHGEP